jgi:hypothetical protein
MEIGLKKTLEALPALIDIFEKLDIKNYIEQNKVTLKDDASEDEIKQAQKEASKKIMLHIAKSANKVADEACEVVAILHNITKEEAEIMNPIKAVMSFAELFNDEDFMSFFKSAMQ